MIRQMKAEQAGATNLLQLSEKLIFFSPRNFSLMEITLDIEPACSCFELHSECLREYFFLLTSVLLMLLEARALLPIVADQIP